MRAGLPQSEGGSQPRGPVPTPTRSISPELLAVRSYPVGAPGLAYQARPTPTAHLGEIVEAWLSGPVSGEEEGDSQCH